ncbi:MULTISPECIES: beta-ketoacyl synthase N-terminal-like domain-containing protein [Streptomyces]|uniref:beta-ketoacyl synthase N-terminal-like domain-containing protein n=1 Tax=Streptomyces TaxID=1883 RepID=UPI000AC4E5C6
MPAHSRQNSRNSLDLIRLGRADVVVAGGADAGVHPLGAAAFAAMRAGGQRTAP